MTQPGTQPASKRLLTEAAGNATYVRTVNGQAVGPDGNVAIEAAAPSDAELAVAVTAGATGQALDSTYGRNSLHVRNFLTEGATPAQNRTAIQTAVTTAAGQGKDLCFDGVSVQIAGGPVVVSVSNIKLWGSNPANARIIQMDRPLGVFEVTGTNVTFQGLHFDGNNSALDLSGFDEVLESSHGVMFSTGAHRGRVLDCTADGLVRAVYLRNNPRDHAGPWTNLEDCIVDGLTVSNVWAAVYAAGVTRASFNRLRGSYKKAGGSGAPPHMVYLTTMWNDLVPKFWNYDVSVTNSTATGGRDGVAFSLRATKGLRWDNLSATDNAGLIDLMAVEDFVGGSWASIDDVYPWPATNSNGDRGALGLYLCKRGTIGPGVIDFKSNFHSGRGVGLTECEDVTITRPTVNTRLDVAPTVGVHTMIMVAGNRCTVVEPEANSLGAAVPQGILITGKSGTYDSPKLVDPKVTGAVTNGIRITAQGIGARIEYNPDKVAGTTRSVAVDGSITTPFPTLINMKVGARYDGDPTIVGWNFGEHLGSGAFTIGNRWPSGQVLAVGQGAWSLDANGFIQETSNQTIGLLTANFGSADTDIECTVKLGGTSGTSRVGLALRCISATQYLGVILDQAQVAIVKRAAGGTAPEDVLATAAVSTIRPVFYTLRAVVVGSVVTVFLNGTQVTQYTLTSEEQTMFGTITNHGLLSRGSNGNHRWHRPIVRRTS
ncbi:hypothetical protein NXT08_22590 [Rhodococcus pyridinivorans]|uniref:hypothetical protein n=1 Tax=Rhodococcus pyridinivorans TaxID=103816 RepID=UPI0021640A22|nr:hypothetical protein [Rhodococcus pyridinivorans]UVT24992.1 hypothetical protein NXT08_22590 [Rhodococcus pyridinivorans]